MIANGGTTHHVFGEYHLKEWLAKAGAAAGHGDSLDAIRSKCDHNLVRHPADARLRIKLPPVFVC